MRTRQLRSQHQAVPVSALCLGVMALGVHQGEDSSYAVLDRYFEAGGRFLDTANNYGAWTEESLGTQAGDSERLLGRWIASRGVAEEVVVATKCGAGKADPRRPLSGQAPTNYEGLAPEVVRRELTASLERLGLPRVGVYYGHVDDRTRQAAEIADTFADLVEEGLVQVPGLSNTTTWRLAEARAHSRSASRPAFGAWQQEHSLYWPAPGGAEDTLVTREGLDYAAEHPDLTILSYSPLQKGQLARPWLPLPDRYAHPGSGRRLLTAHQIAHAHGSTVNQVVLAWHLAGPASSVRYAAGSATLTTDALPLRRAAMIPVIGARTVEQLDEALGALDVQLDAEDLAALDGC
ncbi:aldo/keto reductase [uncultured Friedmanniella sp.]|uniref:aldo/keto reductase n=1 Tax=uncultured Friedmanniella sp. TaxID=335381 RepID=UPI0035CAC6B7